VEVRVHDLTGWWARCDAIALVSGDVRPSNDLAELAAQRLKFKGVTPEAKAMGPYDVVVVGGGSAGCGAAVAAARHGIKVAFIQDRPVLGGNASDEIQVPPMGYIGNPPDKVNVTGLAEEFFPTQGWSNFASSKHIESIVRAEKNITLFLNTRATGVEKAGDGIKAVLALDVHSGQRMRFAAPLFIDCTGHGWVGYYAGAEYRMGQEARAEFNESLAPVEAGKRTMGNSLYKAVLKDHRAPAAKPAAAPGVVTRYSDKVKVAITGDWKHSTFQGGDYLTDDNAGKGTKTIAFALDVKRAGRYDVFLGYLALGNRASNVPVAVENADGTTKATVDQRRNVQGWHKLGTFALGPGAGKVTVSTAGTDNYVIAECVRVAPVGAKALPAEVEKPVDGVPFECPPWAYQWTQPSDFEPRGSHKRVRTTTRPPNFDAPSRGRGRNPGDDINGAILHAWWVEYGGVRDTIQDAEKIRDELFRISIGLWNYAKNYNPKTIERNKYRELVWLNYVPGVRESRRLVGDYIMRQSDFDKRTLHPDTVAFTDWGSDVHHPEGFWVKGNDCIHVFQGWRVSIPYRTLYSKNIPNLFMAGRCHSATHIALGGTRVMRPMCATGQAAGTAAAIARKQDTSPRGVYEKHMAELQQALLRDDCYLMGVPNMDKADLALTARATASSSVEGAPPEAAIDGWNRKVGVNRSAWAPDAKAKGPHWLQLDLAGPAKIGAVHITFEGRGADARVEACVDGEWKLLAEIPRPGRRVAARFEPVRCTKVRVVLPKSAAITEIRTYAVSGT
ncbi:FAD-dependent oxidoreductase, partial [bacterium]|nr:FAD-dependent oxidoreductase [bacterium]